jgi:hypothetical protein
MKYNSSSNDVAFMVVSCDKYSDLWDPFFHCLYKYWPDCPYKIYLLSNHQKYVKFSVTTLNIGDDRSYADNLRAGIAQIKEPWVILFVEDALIAKPVDTERFQSVIADAQSIPVGYLKITPDLPLCYDIRPNSQIGPVPKGVRYRSAIGMALYKVETLNKLLTPGASAWELDKSTISDDMEELFFALTSKAARRPLLSLVHGVIKGKWYWSAIPFLKREGFKHVLKGRDRLSTGSFLYVQVFQLYVGLLRLLKRHLY